MGFNDTAQSTKTSSLWRQENLCAWLICGMGRKVYKSACGSSHLMLHKNIMHNSHRLRRIIVKSKNPQNLFFLDEELKKRGGTCVFLGLVLVSTWMLSLSCLNFFHALHGMEGRWKGRRKKVTVSSCSCSASAHNMGAMSLSQPALRCLIQSHCTAAIHSKKSTAMET